MKYQFVNVVHTHRADRKSEQPRLPSVRREDTKKLRDALADCLVQMTQEWTKQTTLCIAREMMIACIEQAQTDGLSREETYRMTVNIQNIQSLTELQKYAYNYKLRASGLSVQKVLRGK